MVVVSLPNNSSKFSTPANNMYKLSGSVLGSNCDLLTRVLTAPSLPKRLTTSLGGISSILLVLSSSTDAPSVDRIVSMLCLQYGQRDCITLIPAKGLDTKLSIISLI